MGKHPPDPYWTIKAMAKRLRIRMESKLPESKPVPMTKRLTAGLKPGEIGVVGWQCAPVRVPARLQRALAQSAAKSVKRERYERRFKRATSV